MAVWDYPVGTEVQWVYNIRKTLPEGTNRIFTVDSYHSASGIYMLTDEHGITVYSDWSSIEARNTAVRDDISRQDAITQIIVAHSYPQVRYIDSYSPEVTLECRCGASIIDIAPELFKHAMHIAQEIEKRVGKDV